MNLRICEERLVTLWVPVGVGLTKRQSGRPVGYSFLSRRALLYIKPCWLKVHEKTCKKKDDTEIFPLNGKRIPQNM